MRVETRIDFGRFGVYAKYAAAGGGARVRPGLLRALAYTIAEAGCNIEVALVDTEGEMAIDVFYITEQAAKLEEPLKKLLGKALVEAIEKNAR